MRCHVMGVFGAKKREPISCDDVPLLPDDAIFTARTDLAPFTRPPACLSQDKKGIADYSTADWQTFDREAHVPQQGNGVDCGVFTCICADFASEDLPLRYCQVRTQPRPDAACPATCQLPPATCLLRRPPTTHTCLTHSRPFSPIFTHITRTTCYFSARKSAQTFCAAASATPCEVCRQLVVTVVVAVVDRGGTRQPSPAIDIPYIVFFCFM